MQDINNNKVTKSKKVLRGLLKLKKLLDVKVIHFFAALFDVPKQFVYINTSFLYIYNTEILIL